MICHVRCGYCNTGMDETAHHNSRADRGNGGSRDGATRQDRATHARGPAQVRPEPAAADLLVIGARHRRFSDTTVLGVNTIRMLRHAPCPVLAVFDKQ